MLRDDLLMLNCAGCSKELLAKCHKQYAAEFRREVVADKVREGPSLRPYCSACLEARQGKNSGVGA